MKYLFAGLAVVVALSFGSSIARANLIVDPSFEQALEFWDATNPSQSEPAGEIFNIEPTDGSLMPCVECVLDEVTAGSVFQTVTLPTAGTYRFGGMMTAVLVDRLQTLDPLTNPDLVNISVKGGAGLIDVSVGGPAGTLGPFTVCRDDSAVIPGGWIFHCSDWLALSGEFVYDGSLGDDLDVIFSVNMASGTTDADGWATAGLFDEVFLEDVTGVGVSEPSTIALASMAMAALFVRRKKWSMASVSR